MMMHNIYKLYINHRPRESLDAFVAEGSLTCSSGALLEEAVLASTSCGFPSFPDGLGWSPSALMGKMEPENHGFIYGFWTIG